MERVTLDLLQATPFVETSQWHRAIGRAEASFESLKQETGPGSEWLGWRRILKNPDRELLARLDTHARQIREDSDLFIVCGIGGSYLGSRAVVEALAGSFPGDGPTILFAGHHLSGRYLQQLIDFLDREVRERGSRVSMNVISKSGTTLETALAFRTLRNWFDRVYGSDAPSRIVATTAPEGGVLNRLASQFGYQRYVIPNDVGGRFSVLTPVGLLPSGVAGIDTEALFEGARAVFLRLEAVPKPVLEHAALRYCLHEQGRAIDLISSFEPNLSALSGWAQQLFGESEGKSGNGLFPASISYTTDLHSIGQMVQQGRRNLIETILEVEEPLSGLVPGDGVSGEDGLDYLADTPYHEINRQALEGTVEAHREGGVPVIRVRLNRLDEGALGELIYHFELITAVYVYMLGQNPFDQPGVEEYKKAMYRNLGKGDA